MALKIGDQIINIKLPDIDGHAFELDSLRGKKIILSFHRFATCPFCNLRIHQLVSHFETFGDNFTIVAVFDSPLKHLQKHAKDHHAPFPILADHNNYYYQIFNVERSIFKTIKGFLKRFPTVLYAMFVKGYWPFPIKGNLFSMPLEILIDENGIVRHIHKAKDEGDHLSIEQVKAYSIKGTVPL